MENRAMRCSSMSNGGKWFAHEVLPEKEKRSREACTSPGITLTQALNLERFPKWKSQHKSREYPFSSHDNMNALKDNISVFSNGVGLRKSLNDPRQQRSHFCLSHDGAYSSSEETEGNMSVQQTDFTVKQAVNVPSSTRRFPHNHKQRATEAALEDVMWFGRHDLKVSETLQVLTANCSTPSRPQRVGH
ncbi:hypothetical protein JOQ06_019956 [Pogonophryne albipinna]|uniref:Domain of unknown function with conserved HDNR motif domain-containing protein n=1 Tax=Pogonophryne albipinna TaxID=1090488 RepID=A0AAD6FUF8_9TELE|nr:hypothetical protein JOQ06_019956 [Pogonophryne albipinna]